MIRPPATFGHEFAGVIQTTGRGVQGWEPGDRVVAANSAPCGRCFYCLRSRCAQCEDLQYTNGAYAEYALLPSRLVTTNLMRVPYDLSFEHAALVEPLACVVHGMRDCGLVAEDEVAIIGDGPIGLFFTRLCALASARVTVVGTNATRLAIASGLGARRAVCGRAENADTRCEAFEGVHGGRGFDVVVECVGSPETWSAALAYARRRGIVNLFGGCPRGTSIEVETARIHYDEITVKGSYHHDPDAVREALRLLHDRRVPGEAFVQATAPIWELPALLADLSNGASAVKIAILPGNGARPE
jgi:L-iditol 2-dehydrogenase